MYWCNCAEGWTAKGLTVTKQMKYNANVLEFQQVSTAKDETCTHCGHYAFFSKTNPNDPK